ncbi:hypothetical protein HFV04_017585 [Pseudomonas sp. BIGb0427]|uniref:hypothetical protein n=1 Tax=unclassified Pseudomonas TaxID=196821 RepID=UPI0018A7C6A0|nr:MULTISPECIES: hypothetical protein [unclassified Pseudomonas]QPG61330.1 hypothetical protein HFV04_017585 [Pseudomonas sp. BIGb0427]UVM68845.1 hypothetical protein LOY34_10080 [Pseudomonas sp. B21-009]
MINKALRILIADERHAQLLRIEKQLNALGYYRIAPVRTFDELASLTSSPQAPFDLLIVNKALAVPQGVELSEFCRSRPQILHTLFYGDQDQSPERVRACPAQVVRAFLLKPPDTCALGALMSVIDPPPLARQKSPARLQVNFRA